MDTGQVSGPGSPAGELQGVLPEVKDLQQFNNNNNDLCKGLLLAYSKCSTGTSCGESYENKN